MILAIDAVGAKHSGAATVAKAVVDAALAHRAVSRVVVYSSPRALRDFAFASSDSLDVREVPAAERGPVSRLWWHHHGLRHAARRDGADAMLCLSGRGVGPPGCSTILFIQQALPFSRTGIATLPLADRVRIAAMSWSMRYAARRAKRVIVQTPTMARCVATTFALDESSVEIIEPSATLPPLRDAPAPELERMRMCRSSPRLLYVGSTSPYKNVGILAPALEQIRLRVPGARLFATIPLGHPLTSATGVEALPPLSGSAIREAYSLATLLVMPSLIETVGLPMLEAASAGTPVLAADRPYAHDVCGDAAMYFDPLDPKDLAVKAVALLQNEPLRCELRRRGVDRAQARIDARPYDRMIDVVAGAGMLSVTHGSLRAASQEQIATTRDYDV